MTLSKKPFQLGLKLVTCLEVGLGLASTTNALGRERFANPLSVSTIHNSRFLKTKSSEAYFIRVQTYKLRDLPVILQLQFCRYATKHTFRCVPISHDHAYVFLPDFSQAADKITQNALSQPVGNGYGFPSDAAGYLFHDEDTGSLKPDKLNQSLNLSVVTGGALLIASVEIGKRIFEEKFLKPRNLNEQKIYLDGPFKYLIQAAFQSGSYELPPNATDWSIATIVSRTRSALRMVSPTDSGRTLDEIVSKNPRP